MGASRSLWSSSACVAERAGEAEVGGDPPPDAAALALAHADGRRRRAGDRQAGRGGHEQGRRVQLQHREIIGRRPRGVSRRRACARPVRAEKPLRIGTLATLGPCPFSPVREPFAMTRSLLDAFWRAVAYCLHPQGDRCCRCRRWSWSAAGSRCSATSSGSRRSTRCAARSSSGRCWPSFFAWLDVGRRGRLPERVRAAGDRRAGGSGAASSPRWCWSPG